MRSIARAASRSPHTREGFWPGFDQAAINGWTARRLPSDDVLKRARPA
jgi:hypothetical protein